MGHLFFSYIPTTINDRNTIAIPTSIVHHLMKKNISNTNMSAVSSPSDISSPSEARTIEPKILINVIKPAITVIIINNVSIVLFIYTFEFTQGYSSLHYVNKKKGDSHG